jgi:hypothetical protein
MNKQDLLKTSLWLVIFIFFLNSVAMKFHWYYSIWWFDMPMHFAGGLFIGLITLVFFPRRPILHAFLTVLFIGIFWELFEFSLDTFITYNTHNYLDTWSDIAFDLAGGFSASAFFLYTYKYEKTINS